MSKELVKKAIEHFNNNEIDQLSELWHDDVQIIRLMTNEVIYEGKEKLLEINKPYMDEGKLKFKHINSIEFGNIVVSFLEIEGLDAERISVYEIEDNKIKRNWLSQFKKDQEA